MIAGVDDDGGLVELDGVVIPLARLAVTHAGVAEPSLRAAIEELQVTPFGEPVPRTGWRALRSDASTAVVAAYDGDRLGWTSVTFVRRAMEWQPQQSSYGALPRPTPAVRGRGFTLSFSERFVTARRGEQPQITVRITNGSAQPWRETGYGWARGYLNDLATGERLPNEPAETWTLGRSDLYVAPGRSTELPVRFLTRNIERLTPGDYAISASYPELALHVADGHLQIDD
jgi:hypothetical protein